MARTRIDARPGLPFIDTARVHVKAAVARLIEPHASSDSTGGES